MAVRVTMADVEEIMDIDSSITLIADESALDYYIENNAYEV